VNGVNRGAVATICSQIGAGNGQCDIAGKFTWTQFDDHSDSGVPENSEFGPATKMFRALLPNVCG
jgi:hypothetical protein